MRPFLFIILVFSSVSILAAQDSLKVGQDGETGKPMLVGPCSRDAFSDTSFAWWFTPEYEQYKPDSVTVKEIEYNYDDVKTTIVMGTWCSDSHEQVPRFFKVMDEAGYPADNVRIICVDREKKDGSGMVDSLNIELVPTFIFYKEGVELGRIVETPKQTMEEDIFEILTSGR